MSFKEVKELRKSGKLEEAYKMAKQELEKEPENIWNKRSIAWVYYDYLKKYIQPNSYETFKKILIKIKDLHLPEDEKMLFDKAAWQIGKIVFGLTKQKKVDYDKINELFSIIKDLHFPKPSESYSFIYKSFHKSYQNWSKYLEFADWWNFDNFRSEDFLPEEDKSEKKMSLVENAYIAYAKKLLEGEAEEVNGILLPKSINKSKIKEFLPKLDAIIEGHPEYQYPPYHKTKLLLALGNNKEALSNFLPFAKKKRNVYWVWDLLADIFNADDEKKLACLCKALSLKTPDKFLNKTRQKLSVLLIKANKYQEAKTEIEKIVSVCNDNKWKIPQEIAEWAEQDWYKNTQSQEDNSSFYKQYVKIAEEIIFADIPEEVVVVEFVNENKKMLNFVKDKSKYGFFNYSNLVDKPKVGDVLKVRFKGEGQDSYYKILTAKKEEANIESPALQDFYGILKIINPQGFGFVENIFIEPGLINKNKLENNQEIKGKAILSYNKKKNEWGWKAITIN